MRIVNRHRHLIHKLRAQFFNRPSRGVIVWIARDRDGLVNRAHERRNGLTSLERVAAPAKCFRNFETNVSRADANMFRVTYPKIDVPHL